MWFKKSWEDISLYKFQRIDEINSRTGVDELDKMLFITCVVFEMTEYQLDNKPVKKAQRLISQVSRIFATPFDPPVAKKIGRYKINYDPSKLTFGQYIGLSFFLQESPVKIAHYALASLVSPDEETHRERADYFLYQPVIKIIGSLSHFIERFVDFNKRYKDLFGLREDQQAERVESDPFNKRYGWIYSASQIADFEKITLRQALLLPVTDAFDNLTYLKAKARYDSEQLKRR